MLSGRLTACRLYSNIHLRFTSTTQEAKSIQPPNPKKINTDMIGPPDPVSNLRNVIFRQRDNETDLERQYRQLRSEVQDWNQKFWTQHNSRFFQEREEYLKNNLPEGKQNLTADEMSVFYKYFLDKNWRTHMQYNLEWYKKNIILLKLAIQVKLYRFVKFNFIKQVKKYLVSFSSPSAHSRPVLDIGLSKFFRYWYLFYFRVIIKVPSMPLFLMYIVHEMEYSLKFVKSKKYLLNVLKDTGQFCLRQS